MEISFSSHLNSIELIITKFCLWHDSLVDVACVKLWSSIIPRTESNSKFQLNLNYDAKIISETAPWSTLIFYWSWTVLNKFPKPNLAHYDIMWTLCTMDTFSFIMSSLSHNLAVDEKNFYSQPPLARRVLSSVIASVCPSVHLSYSPRHSCANFMDSTGSWCTFSPHS